MAKKLHPNVTRGVLPDTDGKLGEKSIFIFRMMMAGLTVDEILAREPELRWQDFSQAAREAIILNSAAKNWHERMEELKRRHPRAYEPWTRDEEMRIEEMYKEGKTIREIAAKLRRNGEAVKQRLERLGLFT